jgi:hypothetical protein
MELIVATNVNIGFKYTILKGWCNGIEIGVIDLNDKSLMLIS